MEGGFRSESRSPKICKLTQNSQRSHKLFGRDVPTWLGSPLPTVQFLCHQSEHFLRQSQKVEGQHLRPIGACRLPHGLPTARLSLLQNQQVLTDRSSARWNVVQHFERPSKDFDDFVPALENVEVRSSRLGGKRDSLIVF